MKKTPLFDIHTKLAAKISLFNGFQMPIQYSGVRKEHLAVRKKLGVFDVSHMGEFILEGPGSFDLLQFVCSNDISKLNPGKAQYNYLPNYQGGVIDDLIVYQLLDEKYLLVVNAANIEKDFNHIKKYSKKFDVKLENISESTALLAIQGPKSIEAMQSICDAELHLFDHYNHTTTNFAGVKNVLVATTGYTGEKGIEIFFDISEAKKIWKAVMVAGAVHGILPAGLAARDTLRLEMGYCLYENEINDQSSPISAGLGWVTKPNTGFLNSATYQKLMREKTTEKLVGFQLNERGIPRSNYPLFDTNKNLIGRVTSGTQSPSLNIGIGLGYVKNNFSKPGKKIFVKIREKFVPSSIVKLPFVK